MRRLLPLILWQFSLLAGGPLLADVVTLKDGRQISGLVESGNIQELHIKVADRSQTIDVHEIQTIQFGISLPAPPPAKAAEAAPEPAPGGAAKAGALPHAVLQPAASAPGGTIHAGPEDVAVHGASPDHPANASLPGKDLKDTPEATFIDSQRGRQ